MKGEKMSTTYPKRLGHWVSRAKNEYEKNHNPQRVYDILSGKVSFIYRYPGHDDAVKCMIQAEADKNNQLDVNREQFLIADETQKTAFYDAIKADINLGGDGYEKDIEICRKSYKVWDIVFVLLQNEYIKKKYPGNGILDRKWFLNNRNIQYLRKKLQEKENTPYVVIESPGECIGNVIFRNLKALGKNVFYIETADNKLQLKDSDSDLLAVADTPDKLLELVRMNFAEADSIFIFADGYMTGELAQNDCLKKELEEICGNGVIVFPRNTRFLRYGSYMTYISDIYGEDCNALLKRKHTKRFSIVIPARNSSETLKYTIKTCLNQSYDGDYEILISDNSTGENADVYALCKELDDPHIVYIKTPFDLHLPKSFEYAFLHTSGEYVFSLGSDDGLLPWALETLDDIVSVYGDDDIIQWERGFYAWPGFNGGQQHQFMIPRGYIKNHISTFYRTSAEYMRGILNEPSDMYTLPMLYINSCFKRSYMEKILAATGRLWDGMCQDIYMGIVNICINEKILNITYPLTIAGMSPASEGAQANTPKKTTEEFRKIMATIQKDNNLGGYARTYYERLLPESGTDVSTLFACLLRMVSIGVLSEDFMRDTFDFKKMFVDLYNLFDVRDVAYDRKIHEMRYAAMLHGDDFLMWFDETIYAVALNEIEIDEETINNKTKERTYREGFNSSGGQMIDASKYGVKDIEGAVRLFAEKCPLL